MANQIVTGVGELLYGNGLQEARDFKGDQKFAYTAKFRLSGIAADEALDAIEEVCASEIGKSAFDLQFPPVKRISEDTIELKLKVAKYGKTKEGVEFERNVVILEEQEDGTTAPLQTGVKIGNGTKARICIQPYVWEGFGGKGVTLQPRAVQITTLTEFTGRVDGENAEEYFSDVFSRKAGTTGAEAPASAPASDGGDF